METCRRNHDDRADRIKIVGRFGDVITTDHKVLNEERGIESASQICSGCARPCDSIDSKLSMQKQNQLRRRREVEDNSYVQKKTQDPFVRTILWNLLKLGMS